ncbi:MAG: hypothetical protein KBA31_21035 [Alphaproteobacteria bacterium]|nr:hypothetical protein [Alphaproteobacteria bacterium]
MDNAKLLSVVVAVAFVSVTAVAAPATFDECRKLTDAEERLACFDALPSSSPAPSVPAPSGEPTVVKGDDDMKAREAAIRAREAELAEREAMLARERANQDQATLTKFGKDTVAGPLDGVPAAEVTERDSDGQATAFKSKITAFTYNAEGFVTVTLANGQVWRQFADRVLDVNESSVAYIESAMMGSFKMTVDGRNRTARVERIDGRRKFR